MPSEPGSIRPDAAGERLDSWKAIAAYLERDVRTVQRWERRERMPVHRHQHDQQASIYAYSGELDAWRRSRSAAPPVVVDAAIATGVGSGIRRIQWALATLLLVLASSALAWWVRPPQPPPTASRRPVLLLADAEGIGTAGPTAGLQTRVVEGWMRSGGALVPMGRVRSALPLLRAGPRTPLSPAVAMALAERVGGIDVVAAVAVSGQVPHLTLNVLAWTGDTSGRELLRLHRAVGSEAALGPVTDDAMTQLHAAAAARPAARETAFPAVTTASLVALRRYEEADALMRGTAWAAAVPLLEDAVTQDPAFASAYAHLAWALSNQGAPPQQWARALDRAEALADGVSAPERAFIAGTVLHHRRGAPAAERAWREVLRHQPSHYWALGNLANVLHERGDQAEAEHLLLARAAAHPTSLLSQVIAADIQTRSGNAAVARAHVDDVAARLRDAANGDREFVEEWLPLAQGCAAWQRGDVAQARIAIDRAAAMSDARGATGDPHGRYAIGLAYLSLGMGGRAESVIAGVSNHPERDQMLAIVAFARGDRVEAARRLRGFSRLARPVPAVAALLPDLGLNADAAAILAHWTRERFWPDSILAPLRAQVLMRDGRTAEALRVLQTATDAPALPAAPWWMANMPTAALLRPLADRLHARYLVEGGREREGLAVLTRAAADTHGACTPYTFGGAQYLLVLEDLVALHRRLGDHAAAARVASTLRVRLAVADADFLRPASALVLAGPTEVPDLVRR